MPSANVLDIASGILIAAAPIGLFLFGSEILAAAVHPAAVPARAVGGVLMLVAVCFSVWLIFFRH